SQINRVAQGEDHAASRNSDLISLGGQPGGIGPGIINLADVGSWVDLKRHVAHPQSTKACPISGRDHGSLPRHVTKVAIVSPQRQKDTHRQHAWRENPGVSGVIEEGTYLGRTAHREQFTSW